MSPRAPRPALDSAALALQGLDAQVRLLPYALALFGLCLPVLLFVSAFAANRVWLVFGLGVYGLNWTLFYATLDWLKKRPEAARDARLRTQIQLAGGALWAIAINQTAWFALGSGPVSEILLTLCTGAAFGVIFFCAPCLPALILIGPAAAAGPVMALLSRDETRHTGLIALGGAALALAFGLILNRHLRQHYALALERESLMEERELALDRAQALARSKSDLVATLSHEIRNGLSGVAHVLAGALGDGSRRAPSRDQIKTGLAAARELIEVLDAALDSESAEAGRLQVVAGPVDVAALARDLALLHRPTAAAKGLELSVRIDETLAEMQGAALGDSARVRQILNHLVGNALKYTVRGRVELAVLAAGPRRLRVEVIDTGPGLTPEELDQAFAPFTRIARTGAGVPGAGLGLSLSRRLAGLMGGEVAAESAPGVGSRFWLELPYDTAAQATEPAAVDPQADRALRVLVAEEDALNAAMLRAVLESLGHRVLHAQDGARALELLTAVGSVDLVMLEGRQQGRAGPDTARRLRTLPAPLSSLPVVALIGGDPAEAQAMLDAGVDAVLRRPATVAGVARVIADARAKARVVSAAAA
jgi:signal transduction histidine kinase